MRLDVEQSGLGVSATVQESVVPPEVVAVPHSGLFVL